MHSDAANPHLAHHFDSIDQQREAVTLGMWVFLVTEIMFFGGIFMGYTVYRFLYHESFIEMSRHLDITLGTVNTAVLLFSSLTMALAVNCAQTGNRSGLIRNLAITLLCGLGFLVIKTFEYAAKFQHHLVPGSHFHFEGPGAEHAQIFMSFYFGATGIHGFHVLIGVFLLMFFLWNAIRGKYPKERYQPVEVLGLYWHFVDLVWIYVFPLFYLIDRS